MDRLLVSRFWTKAIIWTALSEVPPTSKKLSFIPIRRRAKTLFECPTIKLLAAKLRAPAEYQDDALRTTEAKQRGQQRRYKKIRRETAQASASR